MNVGHHLVVPLTTDNAKHREIYDIFAKAARTESVRNAYAVDYCEPQSVQYNDLNKFFTFHTNYWKKLAEKVKLN
jgi:tripartite-type tricarboxylate transporter receptor subunit TctC